MSVTPAAGGSPSAPPVSSHSWTVKVREAAVEALPPDRLLPDGQPTYVASWIYVFGVASIAALIVIITSGCVIAPVIHTRARPPRQAAIQYLPHR